MTNDEFAAFPCTARFDMKEKICVNINFELKNQQ